jgi:uncharacterized membrane protein YphA (DoxX/SURF4 family)
VKKLQRLYSTFPGGIPGLGLLLLRFVLGVTAFLQGGFYLFECEKTTVGILIFGVTAIIIGASLLLGFLTLPSGFVIFSTGLIYLVSPFPAVDLNFSAAVYIIIVSAATILLGPGAFSLDARLFGRREIIIPDNRHFPQA